MIYGPEKNTVVHFIGIGGIGMSGIAEVLLALGHKVTGSDIAESANVKNLKKSGAKVYIGHKAENIDGATVVVYSSAIEEDNEEFLEARKRSLPMMRRAEMLAELMRLKKGIAIAGTHGKTTTTSILSTILHESGYDPTYIIGGVVHNLKGHAKVGKGEFLIAEADESDGTFLLLNPVMSVITNIDNDHLSHYKTFENLKENFLEFANKVPFYGLCAINVHDKHLMELSKSLKKPWVTFGVGEQTKAHFVAKNARYESYETSFDLYHLDQFVISMKTNLQGRHNVLNALGAICMAYHLGVSFEKMAQSILKFDGVGRRMQIVFQSKNLEVIDDYAHHPTEVATTLEALKLTRPGKKIVALFQPHRFTRTRDCWNDFFHCFNSADSVYLVPVYPASEAPIKGITSERLSIDINKIHPGLTVDLKDAADFETVMKQIYQSNIQTCIVSLGAGPIGRLTKEMIDRVENC